MTNPTISLNEKYKPLITSPSRYFICSGGRGSGKSYSVATYAVLKTFEKDNVILFTRWTMVSAHLSVIPEFLDKIEKLNLEHLFHVTKNEVINKITGSRIIFRGIKTGSNVQTANLKSIEGLSLLIIDESEELVDEKVFDTIDLSIRSMVANNQVILILNPTTKEHFIYTRFFEKQGVSEGSNTIKDNVTYIHTTYLDNYKNLSQSFLDRVEYIKQNEPDKYRHQILGGWLDKAEGVIFSNWEIKEFKDNGNTIFGQDYGFSIDSTTLVEVSVFKDRKEIYARERCYKTGMSTDDIFAVNKRFAGDSLIIADSAEVRLIQELKSKGNNIEGAKKGKGSITAGISLMQDFTIYVDPDSSNLIKEFNNYQWSDKKNSTPVDNWNDAIDAVRYVVQKVMNDKPIRTRRARLIT